jgi:RNA polymerase sigma-70 factor, ECF subfamily
MDIDQLVAEYHQAVYRYAYRLAGTVPDAEDLTQQAFLVASNKLGQLRSEGSVRSWLFAILRNHFFKQCQKDRPIPTADLRLNMDSIPQEEGEVEIDQEQLQQALDDLPDAYRMVLVMFYYEQLSYREMSEALGVPIGTIMSRLARAKGQLRSRLLSGGYEENGAAPQAVSPLVAHSKAREG